MKNNNPDDAVNEKKKSKAGSPVKLNTRNCVIVISKETSQKENQLKRQHKT
jgi:hypothetical protein